MLTGRPTSLISIIIPVLDEAEHIRATLTELRQTAGIEIIVADGGSRDGTCRLARSFGARVLTAPAGRARQMNAGAGLASGDILLFLHADTILPGGFGQQVRQALARPGVVGGAFKLSISGPGLGLRLIEWAANQRAVLGRVPYGDQAIFLSTAVFRAMGGFRELPIMEDFELVSRLRKQGRITILPVAVSTSARRWRRAGLLRTTFINQAVVLGYWCKICPGRLARWYRWAGDRG